VVTLGWSPARRRGSGGGKPARQMPGQWGKRVRRSGMDGETNGTRGRRKSAGDRWLLFKGWRGTSERGGPTVEMPRGVGWRGAWLRPAGGVPADRGARGRCTFVSAVARRCGGRVGLGCRRERE
jgi:hypothetical protein